MRAQAQARDEEVAPDERQVPDVEKRKRADFIVPSGLGRAITWRSLRDALRKLAG